MQLVIDLDDAIIDNLKKDFSTDNIKEAITKLLHNYKHKKEYKMANDLQQSLNEVKSNKTNPISKLLNEL